MEEVNIPRIGRANARTLEVVHEVEWKLPGIRSQLVEIRKVYDLGRRRVRCFLCILDPSQHPRSLIPGVIGTDATGRNGMESED